MPVAFVIAIDQDHARGIAALLRANHGVGATIVLSDDPDASDRIAEFAGSSSEWLVAVRMVSEGVDIPRLRVGVYATTTTTDLFFRQAVGRFARWVPGIRDQRAWLYLPDDPRLRLRAAEIAEQRRHSLRRDRGDGEEGPGQRQTSSPRSSGASSCRSSRRSQRCGRRPHVVEPLARGAPGRLVRCSDSSIEFELAPPPPVASLPGFGGADGRTRRETKDHLRVLNADAARDLARVTGLTHAQVNLELNRLSGIRRVTEATVEQLQERLACAGRWRARLAR